MAQRSRRGNPPEPTQIERDAKEFGVGVRCGGWRLGLLVARNVAPGKAGRPKADDNRSSVNDLPAKVSMNQFAELASVSLGSVKYYYDAWQLAAAAQLVPMAEKIEPGDDEVCIDADAIEVEDNPKTHWSYFYQQAKKPPEKPKPTEKKQDSKPAKESKESEIDSDFGMDDPEADAELSQELDEADSEIQRNELLEVLESVRAIESRLSKVGAVVGDNDSLLGQIASAALDLNSIANAMAVASEKVEV